MREPDLLLIRFGELALKGGNRGAYEKALRQNLRKALREIAEVRIQAIHARILAYPSRRGAQMARRAAEVFGVKSVSPAYTVPADVDAIEALSKELLDDVLLRDQRPRPLTFRVRVKRADKRFPMSSIELEKRIADHVLPWHSGLEVSLKEPQIELGIEIRGKQNYVFVERLAGPGGLPVGTSGRALCLLSGGIDSPVAAYLGMKRGLHMGFITFHSFPYIGESAKRKIQDLARAVSRYQGPAQFFVVPFTEAQEAIRDQTPERYRVVLYRRMMNRIASRIADRQSYKALVTGENLAQVASQTLKNMDLIGRTAEPIVLRPLVGFDKEEIIAIARRIGTFEISNRPELDCCTLFQPKSPVIFGHPEECEAAEAELAIEDLVERAVEGTVIERVDPFD